jgi:hypothetical protein
VATTALATGQTADAHSVIKEHQAKKLSLTQRIHLQRRIVRHDKWVIRTAKIHTKRAVWWHKKQLAWTTRELAQSLSTRTSLDTRFVSASTHYSSSICWACWDRVAYCESGGNWGLVTGNGFYGGLQWVISTWLANGGGRYASMPNAASREQQITIAAPMSLSNWPVCGSRY